MARCRPTYAHRSGSHDPPPWGQRGDHGIYSPPRSPLCHAGIRGLSFSIEVTTPMSSVRPIEFLDACRFIKQHHRHSSPPTGHRFSISLIESSNVRGVLIAGRPVARSYNPLIVIEALRVCTDGVRNGCSQLLSAMAKASKAMGYQKAITYTQAGETGSSLRGAGWHAYPLADRSSLWTNRPGRQALDHAAYRWEATL